MIVCISSADSKVGPISKSESKAQSGNAINKALAYARAASRSQTTNVFPCKLCATFVLAVLHETPLNLLVPPTIKAQFQDGLTHRYMMHSEDFCLCDQ